MDQIGLAGLALFSMASVAGYATFGRHPELLATFPSSAGFFPVAFEFFARGHILVAFAALAVSPRGSRRLELAPGTGGGRRTVAGRRAPGHRHPGFRSAPIATPSCWGTAWPGWFLC